jgi:hypothetical protein
VHKKSTKRVRLRGDPEKLAMLFSLRKPDSGTKAGVNLG